MMEYKHVPVLLEEVLKGIELKEGDRVVDCTLGGAGYTQRFSELVGASGKVYSFDLDKLAIENAKKIFQEKGITNVELINNSFFKIKEEMEARGEMGRLTAIVMDLGLSSAQLSDTERGFSFLGDAPLDMTFGGQEDGNTITQDIVNYKREKELENIIRQYGEEKYAHGIAKAIVKARQDKLITRSGELREIIKSALPNTYLKNSKIHFATRTFQALRIASNDELNGLSKTLPDALELLTKGGRLAVVSFHSLEDRIIKNFFRDEARDCICPPEIPVCVCGHIAKLKLINKKPIEASEIEIKNNPRSRSAKLRVAEKI